MMTLLASFLQEGGLYIYIIFMYIIIRYYLMHGRMMDGNIFLFDKMLSNICLWKKEKLNAIFTLFCCAGIN